VFTGSLKMANEIDGQWDPGVYYNRKNMECTTYYSYFGKYLLNNDYVMVPLLELSRRREYFFKEFGKNNEIFMRPDSGSKTFAGNIYPLDTLDIELHTMDLYAGRSMDNILVVVATPKVIDYEWRIVIADHRPVAASLYKVNNEVVIKEGCDDGAWDLADAIACEVWQPDRCYVLDIAKCGNQYSLIECNSFSCSGLYACNLEAVVRMVSAAAKKEYEEYLEV
jgi:hypothetical protein